MSRDFQPLGGITREIRQMLDQPRPRTGRPDLTLDAVAGATSWRAADEGATVGELRHHPLLESVAPWDMALFRHRGRRW